MSESPKVNVSVFPELIHKFNTDNTDLMYFCVCGHKIVLNLYGKAKELE